MKVAQDHREDLEVLLVLEHILIQAGAIKDIQITEDRDLLVPLRDTVDTLRTLVAMEDILPTLKAIHKVIEVRVHFQATLHHRDMPVPDPTQMVPLPRAQMVPKTLNLTPLTRGSIHQINPLHTVIILKGPHPLLANMRAPLPPPGHPQSIIDPLDTRDLPVLSHPRDHPQKRKGDSPAVMMVDQKVRSLG